jgi:predicted transposase YdaD
MDEEKEAEKRGKKKGKRRGRTEKGKLSTPSRKFLDMPLIKTQRSDQGWAVTLKITPCSSRVSSWLDGES